jgi:transcriptional regulator with XRE-family HTH domain
MEKSLITDRLKISREKLGITMAEAARRLNLSKIGYCRYEYGERIPSMQTLEVISHCFDTSVDYLTGATDDPSPDSIVINKKDSPELYMLARDLSKSENPTIKRLLAYYEKIKNSDNS